MVISILLNQQKRISQLENNLQLTQAKLNGDRYNGKDLDENKAENEQVHDYKPRKL